MICLENIARYSATALLAVACLGSTPTSAFADTYTVYQIGPVTGYTLVKGIDRAGDALVAVGAGIDTYTVYSHGNAVSTGSAVPSSFVPDNGSPCAITYQGFTYQGVCNNGYQAFGQHFYNLPLRVGLYVGHDGSFTGLDVAASGLNVGSFVTNPDIYLNSFGDVDFLDEFRDSNFQAYNTTTPEPSSYLLLLTGIGAAFAAHRRVLS